MKQIRNWKLATRMNVYLGLVILFGFLVLTAVILKLTYDNSLQSAKDYSSLTAKAYANELQAKFKGPKETLAMFIRDVLLVRGQGGISRDQVNSMMREFMDNHPELLEVYTVWEPDAFDGKDALFANRQLYDTSGRYTAWWSRSNGSLKSLPVTDYNDPDADYYTLPKKTMQAQWLDPYNYMIENEKRVISSIVLPVIDADGKFLGVFGFDYDMNYLQEFVKSIRPLEGFSTLLSSKGIYIVHGGEPKFQGESFAKKDQILPFVSKGEETSMFDYSSILNTNVHRIFVPIKIPGIDNYWLFQSVIPVDNMLKTYNQILVWSISISVLTLLSVLFIIAMLIRRTLKPLHRAIDLVEKVSKGDWGVDFPKYAARKDEIGKLTSATHTMAINLHALFENQEVQKEEILSQNEEILAQNEEMREQQEKTELLLKERDQLFALSYDMIAVLTLDAKIKDLNPSWEKTLGFTKEELLVKALITLVHPDEQAVAREAFTKLLLEIVPIRNLFTRLQCKDGSYKWFSWNAAASASSGLAYAIARDINVERTIQDELMEAKTKAEAASLAKSDFLASMSHEIRTPMNAIIGMSDLLYDTPLSGEQKTYVETFRKAGENLLQLINDILDFSKVESGHLDLESTEFNLEELVEKTTEILSLRAHGKKLELMTRLAPDIPPFVIGDPGRLRQILFNLIGNAIKFTNNGEIIVRIENDPSASERGHLLFSVTDTGIGIPKHKLDHIFEKFTQADSSTTREYGGTGLGLAISKKIVELMGGSIWVESEEGKGSTFYFSVHFKETDNCPPQDKEVPFSGLRVLVVDDNFTNRLILKEILGKYDMRLTEAENGTDGLELFKQAQEAGDPFNLLIVDNHMPGMDGFEMVAQMGSPSEWKNTTIMMLTSDDQTGNIQRCKELGLASYLVKPVKKTRLLSAIAKAVGSRSEERTEQPAATEAATEADVETGGSKRILLVEDNEDNRLLIRSFLKKTNHLLDYAENGEIALDKRKTESYDLILMDMQMPVMDGYTSTREIRKWEKQNGLPPIPIVALTAHALKEDADKCFEAGCTSYLSKPIKKQILFDEINRYGGFS